MLSADYLDALPASVLDLYEEFTQSIIEDMARRIKKMGTPTATAAWQAQRIVESGALYENVLREVARLTGRSAAELRDMFSRAGVQTMRFDDAIYREAGLAPTPLNLSPAMSQVLVIGLQRTNRTLQNLTLTTAAQSQKSFVHALDVAYLQVTSGTLDYNAAIRQAVKRVAADGVSAISFGGHVDQLDVAVRRAVLTGVGQAAGALQLARADEMGVNLVQTSAHIGARPTHQVWQGRVFSRNGATGRYPNFVSETGYGTIAGLAGVNCRHSFFPFFPGISENAYKRAELQSFARKTVSYNGQDIGVYEATQAQRAIERQIRYWKRRAGALEAAGLDNDDEKGKVRLWQAKMRDFIRQTNLSRQPPREQV